ncbi:MAG: ABC transporter substrate-binding protein [Candidatus Riflebacteria bacterium]
MKKSIVIIGLALLGIALYIALPTADKNEGKVSNSKNTFAMYLSSEPTNLDPARGVDVNEATVQSKIFDGLVKYNSKMKLEGSLAETWEILEEGKKYVFNLKKNVLFHDGSPLTAKDAVYSLARLCVPSVGSPRRWVLDKVLGADKAGDSFEVTGIEAVDDYKVIITLKEPFAPFISLLTMPACYVLPEKNKSEIAESKFFEKPIGTGPFKVTQRVRDSFLKLEINEAYHGQKANVEEIIIRIIPESMKAEMEFESGNLDLLQLYPTNYDRFKNSEKFKNSIVDIPALNTFYVGFNNRVAPFNDVRVRKALNMLIDRDALIKAVYNGRAIAAKGSIPPGVSGYSENTKGYSLDPQKAKKLLAEAGIKELEFDLYHRAVQSAFEICRFIQGELQKHGVKVNLKSMEWSALKDAVNNGEAGAFYMSWYGDYPDGENFLYPLFHSDNFGAGGNRACFKNEEIDKLLEEAIKTDDINKREEMYAKINQKVVDEAPWMYLWHSSESYITSDNVKNIDFSPIFFMDNGISITMKK